MGHVNIGVAWLFNMVYSLALVSGSTWMVVNWAPQAAGAGVAEVMAYLNGCMLPHVGFMSPFYCHSSFLAVKAHGRTLHTTDCGCTAASAVHVSSSQLCASALS